MTYPCHDTGYLLDQYYFQPPISSSYNSANFIPHVQQQSDFYDNWEPTGIIQQQSSNNQQLLLKTIETTRWLPEIETNWTVHIPTGNKSETLNRNDVKNYACPNCHKQYCRKSTLKAHLKQHFNYKPFICQLHGKCLTSGFQECGKCFSQAANLMAHKRIHTGEKPFSCPVCLRPFSQSSSLVTHKRTHTGERPYPCMHCDKAFTDSSTLTKHLRTHTGQKPYQCHLCLMRFTQSGNLHRHMKIHRNQQ